jgi:uncharacterized membrane protein
MKISKMVLGGFLLLMPVMALAQTPPPQPSDSVAPKMHAREKMRDGMMQMRQGEGGNMLGMRMRDVMVKLSPEGREIVTASLKGQAERHKITAEKMRTLQDRILGVMSAEKFDASALSKLFAEERSLKNSDQEARHKATVTALSKLSDADRKIFSTTLQEMRDRRQEQLGKWRDHKLRPNMAQPTPEN